MKKNQCILFGKRLSKLREAAGLTQMQLSNISKIQRVTIAKYETGERAPSIDNLLFFSEYFNVSTDFLFGLADVPTTNITLKSVCDYTGLDEEAVKTLSNIKKSVEDGIAMQPQILRYLSYIIKWDIEQFVTDIAFNYAAIREKEDEKEQLDDTLKDLSTTLITSQNPEKDIMDKFTTSEKIRDIEEEIAFIEFKNTRCFHKLLTSFYDLMDDILADEMLDDTLASEEASDNGEHQTPKE